MAKKFDISNGFQIFDEYRCADGFLYIVEAYLEFTESCFIGTEEDSKKALMNLLDVIQEKIDEAKEVC